MTWPGCLSGAALLIFVSGCQTGESNRSRQDTVQLQGPGYSATIPAGWSQVDPIRINIQEAPVEWIASAAGRLKSRSDFSPLDEQTLTDGSSWILVISGKQSNPIPSPADWVKVFSASESNIRTRSSQAMTMALSVPTSPSGMYAEYIIAGRGQQLVALAGFSREENATQLSSALARLLTSIRINPPGRLDPSQRNDSSDRFLR